MHSYLLCYNRFNKELILKNISTITDIAIDVLVKSHPDIKQIDPEQNNNKNPSIKIDDVRQIKQFFKLNALNLPLQLTILWQAHYLTKPAQHAFLKLLEEPGEKRKIFLVTNQISQILPTIHSRCQIIRIESNQMFPVDDTYLSDINFLNQADLGQRLAFLDNQKFTLDQAKNWLIHLIHALRPDVSSNHVLIKNMQSAYNDIINNINLKLALDQLMIKWRS